MLGFGDVGQAVELGGRVVGQEVHGHFLGRESAGRRNRRREGDPPLGGQVIRVPVPVGRLVPEDAGQDALAVLMDIADADAEVLDELVFDAEAVISFT